MRLVEVGAAYSRSGPLVLSDINLDVEPGDVVTVSGRNGAGKSTLLRTLAGVLRPVSGRIVDRPRVIGWVPERFPAEQPFTVAHYLENAARVRGLAAGRARHATLEWSERLQLLPFLGERLGRLSKGTAQKVGLAQALLVPPGLLVLDEPWEGLDAQTCAEIPRLCGDVVAAGGAVVVSDHQGRAAELPADQRWTVGDGGVVVGRSAAAKAIGAGEDSAVIEVIVPATDVRAAVLLLRGAGWTVRGDRR